MNISLLLALREAEGAFVAADALPGSAADLDELIAFGFGIERHPYLGAAYRGPAEALCPDQIEWGLDANQIGRRVAVWDRVGSTNDLAARASASTSNHGLVLLAEEQTAGRGRRGRSWSAPRGSSILMSALIFPPPSLDDPAWLTALGALAVAEVVEANAGVEARIKWPNDVLVEGRKIAGILVERGRGSVLGIGLNVNTTADSFPEGLRSPATSLRILNGTIFDRSDVARRLILRLDRHYRDAVERGVEALGATWKRRLEAIGRFVSADAAGRSIRGRLIDADLSTGLRIEAPDGSIERVAAASVATLTVEDDVTRKINGGSDRSPLGRSGSRLIDSSSGAIATDLARDRPR